MAKTPTTLDAPLDGAAVISAPHPGAATPTAANGAASPNGNGTRRPKANRVEISGFLRDTPELRYTTKGGWPITDILVATNEQVSQDVRFVAWHEVAEWVTDHFTAGNPVRVIGRVVVRTYTGEDGNERKYLELRADHVLPTNLQPVTTEPGDVDPFAEG